MGLTARSSSSLRLLIVDADPAARLAVRTALEARIARPMMIMETADPATARAMAGETAFDAIAVDLDTIGGVDAFARLVGRNPRTTAYGMSAAHDVQAAVACIRAGAADVIEKPIDGAAFARRIERRFMATASAYVERFEGLCGQSPAMLALFDQIRRLAPSPAPVLIVGPAGVGKSQVARALHARSRRRNGPLVTIDCAATTGEALIAQLFGPDGAAVRAEGGTLLLDDVDALADADQASLARFLDIAGNDGRQARVVASSRRTLDELKTGHEGSAGLRPDLFFRLAVLPLEVPPLEARREDLPVLIEHLLREVNREIGSRFTRLSSAAVEALSGRDWPGNVSQLRDTIAGLVASHDGDLISGEDAAAGIGESGEDHPKTSADIRPLWFEEARLIDEAILAFGGNIAKAAAALEISPSTIYRKRNEIAQALGRKFA